MVNILRAWTGPLISVHDIMAFPHFLASRLINYAILFSLVKREKFKIVYSSLFKPKFIPFLYNLKEHSCLSSPVIVLIQLKVSERSAI